MKSQALQQFLRAIQRSVELQQALSRATNLQQIVTLANEAGFAITRSDLQLWANDEAFKASWWPWHGLSGAERMEFLRGH